MFDHPLDRVPFGERTLLRVARSVTGENLPAATVCYLWDPLQANNTAAANPYSRRVRYVVVQGTGAPNQRWLSESRDVAQDFVTLFGDELPAGSTRTAVPPVIAVVIGADSDNTQARSSGWVAQVQWR
jgi:CubicO group peptidase (beta-lactamase class C family)